MLLWIYPPFVFAPTAPPLSENLPFLRQIYSRIMKSAPASKDATKENPL